MMQSPFPFQSVLLFGFLSALLLIGIGLRAKIPFFQRFLVPGCLLAGLLGLILTNMGWIPFDFSRMETFAYHFFNISFISVGLTGNNPRQREPDKPKGLMKGSLWMALTQGVVFPLQAVVGGLFVMALGAVGMDLFPTFGFLAPLGFEEGPGQALSIGKAWEAFGFENAATVGLSFAAIGFFFAFFVGVPLVNWGVRKGLSVRGKEPLPPGMPAGIVPPGHEKERAGQLTLHSGNADNLAFQAALVGLVLLGTYAFVSLLGRVVPLDVAKMLWGFFFIFGLGFALLLRGGMAKVGVARLMDPGIQRRITGWAVDFLIVSTVAAIQLPVVWQYIIPIVAISLTAGFMTLGVVLYLGKRTTAYNLERSVAIYGTVTGNISSGLLLLRIADPEFSTPVVIEMALMNVVSIPIIGACLVLLNGPIWWDWSVALAVLVFSAIALVCLSLIRAFGLWGHPRF
jgi:ESS family glutamate:Na+ symporter